MRFLLDENVEFRLAAHLAQQGHDVTAIAHDYPHALPDRDVLVLARREDRILITSDRDFGELIFRKQLPHVGVIFLRLGPGNIKVKETWLDHVITTYADTLTTTFIVVTNQGVRVR